MKTNLVRFLTNVNNYKMGNLDSLLGSLSYLQEELPSPEIQEAFGYVLTSLEMDREILYSKLEEAEISAAASEARCLEWEQENEDAAEEITMLKDELASMEIKVSELQEGFSGLGQDYMEEQKLLRHCREENRKLRAQLEEVKAKFSYLLPKLQTAEQTLEDLDKYIAKTISSFLSE